MREENSISSSLSSISNNNDNNDISNYLLSITGYGGQPGVPLFTSICTDLHEQHSNIIKQLLSSINTDNDKDKTLAYIKHQTIELKDQYNADITSVYPLLYEYSACHHQLLSKSENMTKTWNGQLNVHNNLDTFIQQRYRLNALKEKKKIIQIKLDIIRIIKKIKQQCDSIVHLNVDDCTIEDVLKAYKCVESNDVVYNELMNKCDNIYINNNNNNNEIDVSIRIQVKQLQVLLTTLKSQILERIMSFIKRSIRFLYKNNNNNNNGIKCVKHKYTIVIDKEFMNNQDDDDNDNNNWTKMLIIMHKNERINTVIDYINNKILYIIKQILNEEKTLLSLHPYLHITKYNTNQQSHIVLQIILDIDKKCNIITYNDCTCRKNTLIHAINNICSLLTNIFQFISVLFNNNNILLFTSLGNLLYPTIVMIIQRIILCSSIPLAIESVHENMINKKIIQFEKKLISLGLLEEKPFVSLNNDNIDYKLLYGQKIRQIYLEKARNMITNYSFDVYNNNDNNNNNNNNDNNIIVNYLNKTKCTISLGMVNYITLIKDIIKIMNNCNKECISMDSRTLIRDIIYVLLALLPVYWSEELKTIPLVSFLFHNDCLLLCDYIVELHLYALLNNNPNDNNNNVYIIDLVEPLQLMAKSTLKAQIYSQYSIIIEILQKGTYRNSQQKKNHRVEYINLNYEGSLLKLKQMHIECKHIIVRLYNTSNSIMNENTTNKLIGSLLNEITTHIIKFIFSCEDISLDAASELYCILSFIYNSIEKPPDAIDADPLLVDNDDNNDNNNDIKICHNYIPLYKKLMNVRELLHFNQSLKNITTQYNNNRYKYISSIELEFLICALFIESENREKCLKIICKN